MLKLLLTRWCNQKWSTGSHELVVLRGQVKALQHGSPHLLWLNDIDWCDLLSKHQYVSDDTFGPRAPGAYFNILAWRMHHNWYCISLLFEVAFDTSSILLLTPCAHHWIWQIYNTIYSLIFRFAAMGHDVCETVPIARFELPCVLLKKLRHFLYVRPERWTVRGLPTGIFNYIISLVSVL